MTAGPQERALSVSTLAYDHEQPRAVVTLTGQAGIADSSWIHVLLERQAAYGQGCLVVDLSGLWSMDWWMALLLAWASRVVSRRGGTLVLANPQPAVARLLEAAGASRVVTMPKAPRLPVAVNRHARRAPRDDRRDDFPAGAVP